VACGRDGARAATAEWIEPATGMVFVLVPAGEFVMGSPASEAGREPQEVQHEVVISRPFYLGKFEVTQARWRAVMGSNPSVHQGQRFGDTGTLPVEHVSWGDCREFLSRLNQRVPGGGFRLPTEAEWEYACRAGTTTAYSFGDDPSKIDDYAWYVENAEKPQAIGKKKPNPWGLHDMHGNVAEWCSDYYDKDYYAKSPKADPKGPEKGVLPTDYNDFYRVIRGGCWLDEARACRSACRFRAMPHDPYRLIGFRVVCEMKSE
jgi:formylglycine-generating enzyme required for sulfatase activity